MSEVTSTGVRHSERRREQQARACTCYMDYPFENKQGKSCLLSLSCKVDQEEMIGMVVINNAFLERIVHVTSTGVLAGYLVFMIECSQDHAC